MFFSLVVTRLLLYCFLPLTNVNNAEKVNKLYGLKFGKGEKYATAEKTQKQGGRA